MPSKIHARTLCFSLMMLLALVAGGSIAQTFPTRPIRLVMPFAPAKTPATIIARLQAEVRKALEVPRVREVFTNGGYDPLANTPAEAREFMRAEVKVYGDIVRAIRLVPQ